MKITTKRIVTIHPYIARALEADGHNVSQIQNALQSAANAVSGREGDAKVGDAKHRAKKTQVNWRETIPVEFEVKASTPYDFLVWHDSLATHFTKNGEPHGEITVSIIPPAFYMWLAGMKDKATEKAAAQKLGLITTAPGKYRGKKGKNSEPRTPTPAPAA